MKTRSIFRFFSLVFYKLILGKETISIGKRTVLLINFKIKGVKNRIKFGQECVFKRSSITVNGSNNSIVFGDNVNVYEKFKLLVEGNNCNLFIDSNTSIGSVKIQLGESFTKVMIGKDCMLSREIIINTSDFHCIMDLKTNARINKPRDVYIGDHVWVGNGVYINKGAKINTNSVIAARSVVSSKEFTSNSIIAGMPAIVIKEGINWNREINE